MWIKGAAMVDNLLLSNRCEVSLVASPLSTRLAEGAFVVSSGATK
jgi:hypothetical protein